MRIFFFSNRSRRLRGATLVEMAIVMAVVGLLLWASLSTMRALEERRQLEAEMNRLETVRDAIVGYALRHRTRAREIRFVNANAPEVSRVFKLPGGRPYLPCPDWDGDGYEDRIPEGADGFVQGVEVKPDLTVTATIGSDPYAYNSGQILFWFSEEAGFSNEGAGFFNQWRPYGECMVARGTTPWRTLGVEPSDGWGNRHTYYADPVFSNAIFGFDRQTIADMFDPRLPEAPGFALSERLIVEIASELDASCPAVICDGSRSQDCATRRIEPGGAIICAWQAGLDNLILKAGSITKEGIAGRKRFPPGGVTDGLPFVLVSHGPNGRFAVNHWGTLANPFDSFGGGGIVCNQAAWTSYIHGFHGVIVGNRALLQEAANGSRIPPFLQGCRRLRGLAGEGDPHESFVFTQSFFVWEPPGIDGNNDFDDLLLWMTRGELYLAIPGDIPLLPRMVIAYFP